MFEKKSCSLQPCGDSWTGLALVALAGSELLPLAPQVSPLVGEKSNDADFGTSGLICPPKIACATNAGAHGCVSQGRSLPCGTSPRRAPPPPPQHRTTPPATAAGAPGSHIARRFALKRVGECGGKHFWRAREKKDPALTKVKPPAAFCDASEKGLHVTEADGLPRDVFEGVSVGEAEAELFVDVGGGRPLVGLVAVWLRAVGRF